MLALSSTTDSLRCALSASHTTSPVRIVYAVRDLGATSLPVSGIGDTNGTSNVDAVPAPVADVTRLVDFVSWLNDDTVTHTLAVSLVKGGTAKTLIRVSLSPGERLEYRRTDGFVVFNAAGAVKSIQTGTANPSSTGRSLAVLAADVTNNNSVANTIQDVTGLSFPVTNGLRYWFRFCIHYTAAATTTGSRWTVNGPSASELRYGSEYSLTTTSRTMNEGLSAYDQPAAANASSAATGSNIAIVEGFVTPSADGNIIARFASEVASSAIVAKRGSFVEWLVL